MDELLVWLAHRLTGQRGVGAQVPDITQLQCAPRRRADEID
jgi:hypothetical protein